MLHSQDKEPITRTFSDEAPATAALRAGEIVSQTKLLNMWKRHLEDLRSTVKSVHMVLSMSNIHELYLATFDGQKSVTTLLLRIVLMTWEASRLGVRSQKCPCLSPTMCTACLAPDIKAGNCHRTTQSTSFGMPTRHFGMLVASVTFYMSSIIWIHGYYAQPITRPNHVTISNAAFLNILHECNSGLSWNHTKHLAQFVSSESQNATDFNGEFLSNWKSNVKSLSTSRIFASAGMIPTPW